MKRKADDGLNEAEKEEREKEEPEKKKQRIEWEGERVIEFLVYDDPETNCVRFRLQAMITMTFINLHRVLQYCLKSTITEEKITKTEHYFRVEQENPKDPDAERPKISEIGKARKKPVNERTTEICDFINATDCNLWYFYTDDKGVETKLNLKVTKFGAPNFDKKPEQSLPICMEVADGKGVDPAAATKKLLATKFGKNMTQNKGKRKGRSFLCLQSEDVGALYANYITQLSTHGIIQSGANVQPENDNK
eukprot:TRINITY_DN12945_c0_g1_i1.p1 TRINITY_DN12945_c0_g1~~TRINITY_DN12945_c0_g1_i1.p1  ORF type:complete len:250 (+),score=48.29 TRINITY_DN12945_c0_g1_i1:63-812(+)